jgi:hypothetical protein
MKTRARGGGNPAENAQNLDTMQFEVGSVESRTISVVLEDSTDCHYNSLALKFYCFLCEYSIGEWIIN